MKKAVRKLLGVAVVSAFLLAVAGAVATPAQAAWVCTTAPNGAEICRDNGADGQAPGTGGVGGGAGNDIALPPPPPPAPSAPKPVTPPVYNRPPAPAPMPAPAPAPVPKAPVQQVPAPQIQATAKNYAPSVPSGQLPAQNQAAVPAPVKDSAMIEETNPGDVTPAEPASEPSVTPADSVAPAPAEVAPTASSSPSASVTATPELVIDPASTEGAQSSPVSLAGFALAGAVIGLFASFYIVRFFRTRKLAATSISSTDS